MQRYFVVDDGDATMAHVSIIDSDHEHSTKLSVALESAGFEITVCQSVEMIMESVIDDRAEFVIVVFRSADSWRSNLKSFCETIRRIGCDPTIVCILRWPPSTSDDRLFGKEVNVEVIHEY